MAGPTGFEPAISSVTGWHVWPLHHGPAGVTVAEHSRDAPGPSDGRSGPQLAPPGAPPISAVADGGNAEAADAPTEVSRRRRPHRARRRRRRQREEGDRQDRRQQDAGAARPATPARSPTSTTGGRPRRRGAATPIAVTRPAQGIGIDRQRRKRAQRAPPCRRPRRRGRRRRPRARRRRRRAGSSGPCAGAASSGAGGAGGARPPRRRGWRPSGRWPAPDRRAGWP